MQNIIIKEQAITKTIIRQIPLDLFVETYTFDNFISIGNSVLIENLSTFSSQFSHIYGQHNTGKTHILRAWSSVHNESCFIDAESAKNSSDLINCNYKYIAIDNVEYLSDCDANLLFNLYNEIILNSLETKILTSSNICTHHVCLRKDLVSRIETSFTYKINTLNDKELLTALKAYTKNNCLSINESMLKYLMIYHSRNIGDLVIIMNKIVNYALSIKAPVTIPLIRLFSC